MASDAACSPHRHTHHLVHASRAQAGPDCVCQRLGGLNVGHAHVLLLGIVPAGQQGLSDCYACWHIASRHTAAGSRKHSKDGAHLKVSPFLFGAAASATIRALSHPSASPCACLLCRLPTPQTRDRPPDHFGVLLSSVVAAAVNQQRGQCSVGTWPQCAKEQACWGSAGQRQSKIGSKALRACKLP